MVITQRLRAPSRASRVTEPAQGLTTAALDVRLVAGHLVVRSADLDQDLIDFAGDRPVLAIDRASGRVRARRARSWPGAPHPLEADVVLNDRLPWTLRVHGAATCGRLDLHRVRLDGLDLSARAGRFHADLPRPAGVVLVRLAGRGLLATLSVPEGTCVCLWQQGGWQVGCRPCEGPVAADRYDVWLDGGACRCRVETRPADRASTALSRLHVLH